MGIARLEAHKPEWQTPMLTCANSTWSVTCTSSVVQRKPMLCPNLAGGGGLALTTGGGLALPGGGGLGLTGGGEDATGGGLKGGGLAAATTGGGLQHKLKTCFSLLCSP